MTITPSATPDPAARFIADAHDAGCPPDQVQNLSRSARIPASFCARVLRVSHRPAAADPLLQNHSGKVEQTCRFVPGTGSAPPIFRKLVLESAPARPGARRRVSPHSRLQRVEHSKQSDNLIFRRVQDHFHQFCRTSTDKKHIPVTSGHIWSHLVTSGHIWSHLVTSGHIWSHLVTS